MNDLAVEIFLINKINNTPFTDQWKKEIKHGRVKLFYFDKKYELHFLKPGCFPVPHPTPPPPRDSEFRARRSLRWASQTFSFC